MPIRFVKPLFKQISAFVDRLAQESSIQSSELFSPPIGQQSWSHEESSIELSRIFSWSFLFPSLSVFKTVVLFYIWARKLKQAFGLRPLQVCGFPKDKVSNSTLWLPRSKWWNREESIESLVLESSDAPDAMSLRAHVGARPEDVPRVGWIQTLWLFSEKHQNGICLSRLSLSSPMQLSYMRSYSCCHH